MHDRAYVSVTEPLSRLASSRVEFGTGFLPPETHQKGPEDDASAQRPEIGDHHTREMAAKMAFLPASYQLRVSKGWQLPDQGQQDCSRHAVQAHAETEKGARDKAVRDFVNALEGDCAARAGDAT